jgi:hypothetical protein
MEYFHKIRDGYKDKGVEVLSIHRPMHEVDLDIDAVQASAEDMGFVAQRLSRQFDEAVTVAAGTSLAFS